MKKPTLTTSSRCKSASTVGLAPTNHSHVLPSKIFPPFLFFSFSLSFFFFLSLSFSSFVYSFLIFRFSSPLCLLLLHLTSCQMGISGSISCSGGEEKEGFRRRGEGLIQSGEGRPDHRTSSRLSLTLHTRARLLAAAPSKLISCYLRKHNEVRSAPLLDYTLAAVARRRW